MLNSKLEKVILLILPPWQCFLAIFLERDGLYKSTIFIFHALKKKSQIYRDWCSHLFQFLKKTGQ